MSPRSTRLSILALHENSPQAATRKCGTFRKRVCQNSAAKTKISLVDFTSTFAHKASFHLAPFMNARRYMCIKLSSAHELRAEYCRCRLLYLFAHVCDNA